MAIEMKLPDLGENISSGTVAKVLVSIGERIATDQPLVELETEKAVLEVPASAAGVVQEILIAEGDEVNVGQVLVRLDESGAVPAAEAEPPEKEEASKKESEKASPVAAEEIKPAPLTEALAVPPLEASAPEPAEPAELPSVDRKTAVPAAPSVRRFAREIGIDIHHVPGTGSGGRISVDDVKRYAKTLNQQKSAAGVEFTTALPLPDFEKWGEVERQPMSKVRQTTATRLSAAWLSVPHVTQFDKADVTELEKMRRQFAPLAVQAGGKLTMTAILLKIAASALKVFPQFNASIDMQKKEIIYKKYVNIGVAVDTDRGLLVPVIRDVDRKNIIELSVELTGIAERARNRKLTLDEMQGGGFSISNLGGIGGTAFTPIVNAPEVAILGVSRSAVQPVFIDGEFVPRTLLPLSLSYDHRVIDGADGARFVRWIVEALEQPFLLSLQG